MIGAAHVFVITTPRPRGLRTAMRDAGPSSSVVSVGGVAAAPLGRHLQNIPWRRYATSCSSRWGLSEEELPRDWLPRDTEPMSLEVPRQHTDDTSVVLTTSANPTSEVQPSADEPEWRRYRETLRAVYRYHPSIPLPEAPVDETFGGALSALCQGQVREDRYSSLPQSGAPAEVKVRVSQMKDWEMLARAGLGVTNHPDWFLGSIWQILVGVDLGPEKSADLTNCLTSSCVAVNQLAHIQAHTLAANATVRREAFLDASVLHRPGAHFLRSQAIGCVDLLAGRGHEALRTASEEQRTALLFDTTVGASRPLLPLANHADLEAMPNGGDGVGLSRQTRRLPADDLTRLLLPPQLDVRSSVVEEDDLGSPERLTPSQRFDEAQLPIPRPVGARLLSFAREWNRLTTDQFVRSVVRKGYRIELDSSPNLSPVPIPMQLSRDSEKAQSLRQEIISLQERRRLASGVRLEVPQPICPQREIQDDYSQSSDQCVASRGLGGECRPQRRLLPHPHTQEVPTPTSVCCRNGRRAPGFPIQGPTVRTDFSAKGIYESNTTSRTSGAHARGLSSTVSRRLDTTKYRQVITGSANKLVAQCHAPSRSGTKCAQVTLGTHSATDTHRCRISSRRRTDVPADGKSSKDRKQSISASIGSGRDSLFLALPAWTYELGNGCNPIRENAPQTSAVLPASPLGACIKECGSSYPSETQSAQSSSPMVVGQGVHTGRDVVRHSRGSGAAIHRCVRVGLGSPYGHTSGKRSMVCEGGHAPHQPTGDDRSTECIASLSDTVSRTNGSIH